MLCKKKIYSYSQSLVMFLTIWPLKPHVLIQFVLIKKTCIRAIILLGCSSYCSSVVKISFQILKILDVRHFNKVYKKLSQANPLLAILHTLDRLELRSIASGGLA